MKGTRKNPANVKKMPNRIVTAMVVSTVLWSSFIFRAPRYWPITTPPPMENPLKKKIMMLTIMVVELMAARASLPTKLPTTMESTVL